MMKKKPPKEHKDPFAIDVDTIRARTMDKDKKDRLQKEGRCFFCEKQGHLSRQCLKKQGGTKLVMPAAPKPQARATKLVKEDETTQVGDDEEPLAQLRTLQQKWEKGPLQMCWMKWLWKRIFRRLDLCSLGTSPRNADMLYLENQYTGPSPYLLECKENGYRKSITR
jgi:hypothetical protein